VNEDEELIPYLQCDLELNFTGPTAMLNKWAAKVLRSLADRLEMDELDSGWHDVKDNVGKPVGKIYVDYSGELI
jgi:hypothetical protein